MEWTVTREPGRTCLGLGTTGLWGIGSRRSGHRCLRHREGRPHWRHLKRRSRAGFLAGYGAFVCGVVGCVPCGGGWQRRAPAICELRFWTYLRLIIFTDRAVDSFPPMRIKYLIWNCCYPHWNWSKKIYIEHWTVFLISISFLHFGVICIFLANFLHFPPKRHCPRCRRNRYPYTICIY